MKTVKWGTVGIALGIAAVVGTGGVWAVNSAGVFDQPTEPVTSVVEEQPASTPTVTPTFTPTATPTPEPIVEAPVVEAPPEPSGPDLCPGGTTAQSSDGYNDLSCAPDVCLTLRGLPDPAYPQCDYFHEPAYYR